MSKFSHACFVMRAIWELLRYDLLNATFGFQRIHRQVSRLLVAPGRCAAQHADICAAVSLASCFYWKPVLCLQRSVVATRLLRKSGIHGRLVIGYRPSPFFSHAWVEVNGRVVNDSPVYKERLHVLCTL